MRNGTTTTSDRGTLAILRSFSRADVKRGGIRLAIFGVVCVCYWFILPGIQSQIIPDAPVSGATPSNRMGLGTRSNFVAAIASRGVSTTKASRKMS